MIIFFLFFFTTLISAHDCVYYENCVVHNPHDYRALYNVGVTAFKNDDLKKAQAAFDCLKPVCKEHGWDAQRSEQVYYNAGNTEMKLRHYHNAIESFEIVLEYNPENELARKKLELAKQLLEQEQQKQEDQSKQDQRDQGERDSQSDDQKDQGDRESEDDRNENSDELSDDQQDDRNDDRSNQDNAQDKDQDEQGQEKQSHDQEPGKDLGEQQKQSQSNENEQNQQPGEQEKEESGPELTPQEERLLAGLEKLDHDMNKEQAERLFRAIARGQSENNW